jgi:hypothetical protein
MKSFLSDWREAFVISTVMEWGTPWLRFVRSGEQGGGRDHPSITV